MVEEFFTKLSKKMYNTLTTEMKSTEYSSMYKIYNDKQLASFDKNYDKEIAWNLLQTLLNRAETGIKNCPFGSLAFVTDFKNNSFYIQIQKLSCEQFYEIIAHDGEYALKLLKFLSSTVARLNEDAHQRRIKHCGYL